MNAGQERVTGSRKSWGERIKAWLFGNGRRAESKHTVKPRLEGLEQRDVPSTLSDVTQFQTEYNNLTQVRHLTTTYTPTIQKDLNALVQAVKSSQSYTIVTEIYQLQGDLIQEANWYGGFDPRAALNDPTLSKDLRALTNDAATLSTQQLPVQSSIADILKMFPALPQVPTQSQPTSQLGPTLDLSSGFASNSNLPFDWLMTSALQRDNAVHQAVIQQGLAAQATYGTQLPTISSVGLFASPFAPINAAMANMANNHPIVSVQDVASMGGVYVKSMTPVAPWNTASQFIALNNSISVLQHQTI
jgi:hypothetical protein